LNPAQLQSRNRQTLATNAPDPEPPKTLSRRQRSNVGANRRDHPGELATGMNGNGG
jgi:hypothetical protein